MDFTMIHVRFGHSHFTLKTIKSDGVPDPDGTLKKADRIKLRHYRNVYLNRPDPIAFIPLGVDTTGRLYDGFIRLFFFHTYREASVLSNELPEESDQFRFLRAMCFANLKGAVGFIMAKTSSMRISIPLDLSSSLVFHTSSSFHLFVSSHTVFRSFPRTFPSSFCLSGTCWVFILAFHWLLCSS